MRYGNGDILCLNDGREVYVFAVENGTREYQVVSTEDDDDVFYITEDEIAMKLN